VQSARRKAQSAKRRAWIALLKRGKRGYDPTSTQGLARGNMIIMPLRFNSLGHSTSCVDPGPAAFEAYVRDMLETKLLWLGRVGFASGWLGLFRPELGVGSPPSGPRHDDDLVT
jgi:hypothetical protein